MPSLSLSWRDSAIAPAHAMVCFSAYDTQMIGTREKCAMCYLWILIELQEHHMPREKKSRENVTHMMPPEVKYKAHALPFMRRQEERNVWMEHPLCGMNMGFHWSRGLGCSMESSQLSRSGAGCEYKSWSHCLGCYHWQCLPSEASGGSPAHNTDGWWQLFYK